MREVGNFSVTLALVRRRAQSNCLNLLVGRLGLEPRTTGLKGRCSNQLS